MRETQEVKLSFLWLSKTILECLFWLWELRLCKFHCVNDYNGFSKVLMNGFVSWIVYFVKQSNTFVCQIKPLFFCKREKPEKANFSLLILMQFPEIHVGRGLKKVDPKIPTSSDEISVSSDPQPLISSRKEKKCK